MGHLVASVDGVVESNHKVTMTNTYAPKATSIQLPVTKNIKGEFLPKRDVTFTFELKENGESIEKLPIKVQAKKGLTYDK